MLARPAAAAAAAAPTASAAAVIDGKKIAEDIRKEIAAEVQQLQQAAGRAPGLAVVLVGSRKDSETYVRSKKKACAEVGVLLNTYRVEHVCMHIVMHDASQWRAPSRCCWAANGM